MALVRLEVRQSRFQASGPEPAIIRNQDVVLFSHLFRVGVALIQRVNDMAVRETSGTSPQVFELLVYTGRNLTWVKSDLRLILAG